jgi:hypothetical protein
MPQGTIHTTDFDELNKLIDGDTSQSHFDTKFVNNNKSGLSGTHYNPTKKNL